MKKNNKFLIISGVIFLLVLAVMYIFLYTLPKVSGALVKTVVAEYGDMKLSVKSPCVIVREECPVYSKSSGDVSYYVDENIKTRKGIKVLDVISREISSYSCPDTGVVSYYIDGFEDILSPGAIENISPGAIRELSVEPESVQTGHVSEGGILYKIITSDVWYAVMPVNPGDIKDIETGDKVSIIIDDAEISADVYGIYITDSDEKLLAVSTGRYYKDFARLRSADAELILHDYKGLIIPNSAIAEEDGYPGVYVGNINSEYNFTRIEILGSDGEKTVITPDSFKEKLEDGSVNTISSVKVYDELLKEAPKAEE